MNKLIYIFFVLILFSCKKEEIPVKKHLPGDAIINSFEMGSDYRKQAFFDLKTNTFVSQNLKSSWDLGFESGGNGTHIIINTANAMALARVSNATFNSVTDTTGLVWRWDATSGNLDSTAVGDWQIDNFVYVVDRGYDHLGIHRGVCKLMFNNVTANSYSFKVAKIDGSLEEEVTVLKDDNVNFTSFSLSSREVIVVEPSKISWDFMFTRYINYFDFYLGVENKAYLVTGVLINRHEVQVAEVNNKGFDAITSEDISKVSFSSKLDEIGFDWKDFDFDTGDFLVNVNKNYIIRSTEGLYYKLHFLDFYNNQGDKGTPTFELQEL